MNLKKSLAATALLTSVLSSASSQAQLSEMCLDETSCAHSQKQAGKFSSCKDDICFKLDLILLRCDLILESVKNNGKRINAMGVGYF